MGFRFEAIAEGFLKVIKEGENGSVWVAENGEPAYEVVLPEKKDLRKRTYQ